MTEATEHLSSALRAVVEGRHLDPYQLKPRDISAISGLPQKTVERLVRGADGTRLDTAVRLALATGISLDELAGLEKCDNCGRTKRSAEECLHCGYEAQAKSA